VGGFFFSLSVFQPCICWRFFSSFQHGLCILLFFFFFFFYFYFFFYFFFFFLSISPAY